MKIKLMRRISTMNKIKKYKKVIITIIIVAVIVVVVVYGITKLLEMLRFHTIPSH